MMRHRSTVFVAILAVACGVEVATGAEAGTGNTATYNCTEVDVPGAASTILWRLNNSGYVAASSTLGAYIYNPNAGVWLPLPTPPAASGYAVTDLVAFDINDQGTIVGAAQNNNVNGGVEVAFILGSIGNPASYTFYSHPDPNNAGNNNTEFRGINDSGLITGWSLSYVTGLAGGFVFNPTNAAIGTFPPGYTTFEPVLSDGSTSLLTQLAGINSAGLIAGSAVSNTVNEAVLVGPNSLSFAQIPNASFQLRLRGVNDGDPYNAGNCDAGGTCVRAAGFGFYAATGNDVAFYLDYDPASGYVQTPQIVSCSSQIPASANTLVGEGINNSDTIVADYSDTAGNSHGVIAYAATSAPAASCSASDGGCDLSNGVIPHSVTGGPNPLPGTVTESLCKVPQDPRIVQYGSCTGHTLPVAQVCPGFGNTVIPDYLCGGAGPSHSGFALANTVAEGVDALSGIYVDSEASADLALGGTSPTCPQTVGGWAPRSASAVEGTVPEGDEMLELTEGCGSSKIGSRGLSIYGIGLILNTDALPGNNLAEKLRTFTATKYANLYKAVADGNMVLAERIRVNACVAASEIEFAVNRLGCAAQQIVRCDTQVAGDVAQFSGSPSNPNVWGDIQGRLANLYLTINTRLLGNPANTSWPPTNMPSCK
jgi:hypothetical protein